MATRVPITDDALLLQALVLATNAEAPAAAEVHAIAAIPSSLSHFLSPFLPFFALIG
jgi:hypothetical protein